MKLVLLSKIILLFASKLCESWLKVNILFKFNTISLIILNIFELSKGKLGLFRYEGKILKNSYKNKPDTVKAKGIFLVYWNPVSKISVNLIWTRTNNQTFIWIISPFPEPYVIVSHHTALQIQHYLV